MKSVFKCKEQSLEKCHPPLCFRNEMECSDAVSANFWPFFEGSPTQDIPNDAKTIVCQSYKNDKDCERWIPCKWQNGQCKIRPPPIINRRDCAQEEWLSQNYCTLQTFGRTLCLEIENLEKSLKDSKNFVVCDGHKTENIPGFALYVAFFLDEKTEIFQLNPKGDSNVGIFRKEMCAGKNLIIKRIYFALHIPHSRYTFDKDIEVWSQKLWLGKFHRTSHPDWWIREIL